jgi:hypothetical protein
MCLREADRGRNAVGHVLAPTTMRVSRRFVGRIVVRDRGNLPEDLDEGPIRVAAAVRKTAARHDPALIAHRLHELLDQA